MNRPGAVHIANPILSMWCPIFSHSSQEGLCEPSTTQPSLGAKFLHLCNNTSGLAIGLRSYAHCSNL